MATSSENNEAIKKQPAPVERVDQLIQQKDSERHEEGMKQVLQQAEGVQGEVADVMAGMEAPSERISERNREDKKGDLKTGSTQQSDDDDQAAQIKSGLKKRSLPRKEVMIKKIRTAINLQIKNEMKKAAKLKKNMAVGGAQEYNASIARIRGLKQVLKSLFNATVDKITSLYFNYFSSDGRRKTADQL